MDCSPGCRLDRRSISEGAHLPDVVTIYREGILAASADDWGRVSAQRLRRQIRITILHELAHSTAWAKRIGGVGI